MIQQENSILTYYVTTYFYCFIKNKLRKILLEKNEFYLVIQINYIMKMKFGCQVTLGLRNEFEKYNSVQATETIEKTALIAEELGYDSIWLSDHFVTLQDNVPTPNQVYEALTTLTYLAGITKKIRLGNIVLCNNYRNPALLAKMTSCLDVLSRGRFELGIGAGWYEPDYTSYGYIYPEIKIRIAQLEESIQIIKKMWTEESPSFDGEYYNIKDAFCSPKPVQKPHPPIMIAGGGKMMLRLVAKYANISNFFGAPEIYRKRLDILDMHCEDIGRKSEDITKSVFTTVIIGKNTEVVKERLAKLIGDETDDKKKTDIINDVIFGTSDEIIERISEYVDMGVKFFIPIFQLDTKFEDMEIFRDNVMSQFR